MKFEFCWSQLEKLRQIKIISSMYIWIFLLPVLAKLLVLTNDVATVTVFNYTFDINLSLPFSWKLFYFSALFFALATIIYHIRCPRLIKEYPTFSSFDTEGKPEWHLRVYAEDLGLDYTEYKEEHSELMREHEGEVSSGNDWVQSIFWDLHWRADEQRKKMLYACLVSYLFGFILITYVLVQNLIWVVRNISLF
ncbi:MAG: hypothetical protein HRT51_14940 [Colwellia sp.]|nr:hypothetical protein [Colwellia sp.]